MEMDLHDRIVAFQFANFTLDMKTRCLSQTGRPISLTPKELKTLLVLVQSAGTAVEKEQLIREVWPDTFVGDGSLTRNISVLRKHLGGRSIETVAKFGYRFVYPVTEVQQVRDERFTGQAAVEITDPSFCAPPVLATETASSETGSKRFFLAAFVSAAMLAIFGLIFVTFRSVQRNTGPSATPVRLAVLPFHRLSNPASTGYLVDGLSEELTTTLGQMDTDQVRVLASGSSNLYRETYKSPAQISRELGARYLVDGTVQVLNEEVEFTVHLIDGQHQEMLWSGKFTRPLSQLPEMRTEMADAIAKEIQIKIAPDTKEHAYLAETSDPQAHQAFLHGRYELEQQNVAASRRALEQFTNAAAFDPRYARAYAGIAESYIDLATSSPPGPAYAYAKAAALNAIRLDNSLSQAHRDLAKVLFCDDNDLHGAELEYRRALQLNPSDAKTHHWYAQLLMAERRTDEALREASTGLALDPLSLGSNSNYAFILIQAGQPAQAVLHLQELQKRDPKNELIYEYLGRAYDGLHEYDRAAESFKQATELSESKYRYEANLAYALAKSGDVATAQALADSLEVKADSGAWIPASAMTEAYIGLGKKDRAFFWFNRCVAEHSCTLLEANAEPIYSGLSGDRRFEKIAGPLYGRQNELAQIDVRK
jgi:DNA-binding winged helix-turn-helix (wHTH) protein/TolB-like protein/Flp pilus assembly protein TadD